MKPRLGILISLLTRAALCVVVLGVAAVVFAALFRSRPMAAMSDDVASAPPVAVLALRPMPVRRQFRGYGSAEAMNTSDVPARVSATVVEIPDAIEPGASVEAGELLVRLDDHDFSRQAEITAQSIADLSAQLDRLTIEQQSWRRRTELAGEMVALAQAEFDRVQDAVRREAARPRELDLARQALVQAMRDEVAAREELDKIDPGRTRLEAQKLGQEASLRLALENVARCRIVSPLDGVLQSVDVEEGENLQVGQRVARVVDLERIEVPLLLPQQARAEIAVGDLVELRSAGAETSDWTATVTRIAPENNASTRTVAVYVEVRRDGPDGPLPAPGTFLEGTVTSSRETQRWVVPRRAVRGERLLYVRDETIVAGDVRIDHYLQGTFPELGLPDTQWVVLATPQREGEQIVVNAARRLSEGMRVQAVTEGDGAFASSADGAASGASGTVQP